MIADLIADLATCSRDIPRDHPQAATIAVVAEALRRDRGFLSRHPTELYNRLMDSLGWQVAAELAHGQTASVGETAPDVSDIIRTLRKSWFDSESASQRRGVFTRSVLPPLTPLNPGRRLDFDLGGRRIVATAFSDDDRMLSVVAANEPNAQGRDLPSGDAQMALFDVESGDDFAPRLTIAAPIHAMGLSPDRSRAVLGDAAGRIYVVDPSTGQLIRSFDSGHGMVGDPKIPITPRGARPAHREAFSGPYVTDHQRWSPAYAEHYDRERTWIRHVCWLPDGSAFATAGQDGTIRVWSAEASDLLRIIQTDVGQVFDGLTITADNRFIGCLSSVFVCWNAVSGDKLNELDVSDSGGLPFMLAALRSSSSRSATHTRSSDQLTTCFSDVQITTGQPRCRRYARLRMVVLSDEATVGTYGNVRCEGGRVTLHRVAPVTYSQPGIRHDNSLHARHVADFSEPC